MPPPPGICDQCGSATLVPLSGAARLRHWFVNGGGLRAQVEACRNCGASGSRGGGYLLFGGRRAWRVPLRVLQAIRQERNWHPVPILYAYVGATAGALVTVPAVLVRPPHVWRFPAGAALGAMIGVFGLSIVSAFRGGGAVRAIRQVVAPRRVRAEASARIERLVRDQATGRMVLVPVVWNGLVALGGTGVQYPDGPEARLVSLSVVAASGAPGSAPRLTIEHEYDEVPASLLQERAIAYVISDEPSAARPDLRGLDPRRPAHRRRIDEIVAAEDHRREARERELAQRWSPGTIRVDGEAVEASLLIADGAGAAVFDHEGVGVAVTCAGLDPADLDLATTQDLDLLIEGRRRREAAMFG